MLHERVISDLDGLVEAATSAALDVTATYRADLRGYPEPNRLGEVSRDRQVAAYVAAKNAVRDALRSAVEQATDPAPGADDRPEVARRCEVCGAGDRGQQDWGLDHAQRCGGRVVDVAPSIGAKCRCTPECEMPCWQRAGLLPADQDRCGACGCAQATTNDRPHGQKRGDA
jgi:hypothetical protein